MDHDRETFLVVGGQAVDHCPSARPSRSPAHLRATYRVAVAGAHGMVGVGTSLDLAGVDGSVGEVDSVQVV